MARKRTEQPAYQYHVSGQAKVRLGHVDFYLGKHGTPESYARYYALLAEYNANGKQPPVKQDQPPETHQADSVILVKHIAADFRHRVLPTHEHSPAHHGCLKERLTLQESKHAEEPAVGLGQRKLELLLDSSAATAQNRLYANGQTGKLIKIFEHGAARALI